MVKYIFMTLAVAVAWSVVIWLEQPAWIGFVVTGIVVAIVATLLIVKLVRARRASREIERALKAQAEAQANSARPDLEADIRSLQGEFNNAISALKGSRLGAKGAASALYSLPWYVIVGPPGVGKSTALRNSGLKFPFCSSRGGVSVQGVGGTRNCEWWMTTEAIILDTAGRYTTESSDREEWFAFLDLLRKYRTRRPINGVIAAVNIADISEAHPEEVASLAREIRARIDELQGRLGIVVPVYLVFTKCDLLPGFVEMFSDLTEADRHQIWGFTLSINKQYDLANQVTEHFDELTSVLEKRSLRRLAEERSAHRRDRIYEFPQYVAALRDPIARFVHEMGEGNIYNETPILRGVYLSSGTQEGRPVNRIMSSIAEAFGIRPTMGATAAPPASPKSYFLGEIFRKVIFKDWRLTRHNRACLRKSRVVGTIAGAVSLVMAIAIVWLPLMSYRRNRQMLGDAGVAVAYVEQHADEATVTAIALDRIEPLRLMVELLRLYEEDGSPWAMRMGMYQGARVYPRLRDLYADTVRRELLLPTVELELNELNKFVIRYGRSLEAAKPEEYEQNFDRLRMVLLLSAPTEAGEPGLNEIERQWLIDFVSDLWERPIRVGGDTATISRIQNVATTYVDMLREHPDLAFERDIKLVERVRDILVRSDRTKAVANALIASVRGRALNLRGMVGVSIIKNEGSLIRPAFTRKGYDKTVRPRFESGMDDLLDPQWVVAPGDNAADELKAEEIAAIETEYFRQYIQEWRTFIDRIYLEMPETSGNLSAMRLLEDLAPPREPYKDLFTHVAWHTGIGDFSEPEGGEGSGELGGALAMAGNTVGRRAYGRIAGRLRLGQVGVTPQLLQAAGKAAAEGRLIADLNSAEVLTEFHVTIAFQHLTDFGARKAPELPQDGSPPPPQEATPIDEYQEQLKYVYDALQARIDDPADKAKLKERLKTARKKVKSLLSANKNPTWSPTLEKLLWPPLEVATRAESSEVGKERQTGWCNEVVSEYERTIASNYPFNREGRDVALADFNAFFSPEKGALWAYYETALKKEIVLRGSRFEQAAVGSGSRPYRKEVVSFLTASRELTTAMYSAGSDKAVSVEFDVLVQGTPGVKQISLTIDGEVLQYRNGPESWTTFRWPGDGAAGASLEAVSHVSADKAEQEGEWGLFRLLEEAKIKALPGGRVFVAEWDFTSGGIGLVRLKFRTKRVDTPFFGVGGTRRFMTIFRTKNLSVPRSVTRGARRCEPTRGR
ncbi:MAG: type VI secretion system membrane subunit TssM [Nannocystaceae bacterium]|nr:type VI secretion system membrane subunit TssM [Nannocystaceae bacterium]